MKVKYVNNNINVMNDGNYLKNEGAAASKLLFAFVFVVFCITLAFTFISIITESAAASELTKEQQEQYDRYVQELSVTQDSGRVVREKSIATATGVGRIIEDTPQGRLLGRRGALTDARRNLLILRQKLLEGNRPAGKDRKRTRVSGTIAGVTIHSERVENNLYFLQVDIPLHKLLKGDIEIEEQY